MAAVDGEVRSYRASRVLVAAITDQACVRPSEFDLAAYWEQSAADFVASLPRYPVTTLMHPDLVWHLQYEGRSSRVEKVGEAGARGWVQVELLFHAEEEACEWLLGFGPQVEVLEPRALRLKVIELAAGIVELHSQNSPS